MPKGRKWTPEQRKAASERAKAAIAEKEQDEDIKVDTDSNSVDSTNSEEQSEFEQKVSEPVVQPTVTLSQEQFQMMLDRLQKSEPTTQASPQAINQAFPQGNVPTLNTLGGVVGVVERFPVDPRHYKSPVDELYEVPELRRYSMKENYVIEWKVTPTRYQTAMGTWYIEPRFELTLKKKQFDENNDELVRHDDNGKPYYPRIVLGRVSFFEDPPANLLEAEQAGIEPDDLDTGEFQEKMRMYRYKFWLIEQLNPKKPKFTTRDSHEEVIGGKVYEIQEYSNPV